MDCFDGLFVSCEIATSPNTSFLNTILTYTVTILSGVEKSIIQSDKGVV